MSVIRGIEVPKFDEMQPGHVRIHVPVFEEVIQIHTGAMGHPEYLRVAATGNERVISLVDGSMNVAMKPPIRSLRDFIRPSRRGPAFNILEESVGGIVLVGTGEGLYDLDDERVRVDDKNVQAFSSFLRKVSRTTVHRQLNPRAGSTDPLK